jgi:hypothetical protein
MSISGISNNDLYATQSLFSQPQQDLQALATDLSSSNLANAQKDFASLQKDVSSPFQSLNNSNPSSTISNGPVSGAAAADLQALQSALNANDLATAQKDFAQFQQDVQTFVGMHKGYHRHHHVQGNDEQDSQSTDTTGDGEHRE